MPRLDALKVTAAQYVSKENLFVNQTLIGASMIDQ